MKRVSSGLMIFMISISIFLFALATYNARNKLLLLTITSPISEYTPKMIKNLATRYLEYQVHIRQLKSSEGNLASLYQSISSLKKNLRTQLDYDLPPSTYSALLLGFGWCDDVNAQAGLQAALLGFKTDLFSLKGTNGISPHTLVRISVDSGFVYLDIWTKDALIFKITNNKLVSLFPPESHIEEYYTFPEAEIISMIQNGFILKEIQPTFTDEVFRALSKKKRVSVQPIIERKSTILSLKPKSDQNDVAVKTTQIDSHRLKQFIHKRTTQLLSGDEVILQFSDLLSKKRH